MSHLNTPLLAIAPMVKQSDSAFREFVLSQSRPLESRLVANSLRTLTIDRLGSHALHSCLLSYTPMLLASDIVNDDENNLFLKRNLILVDDAEQLVLQLAGCDKTQLYNAALKAKQFCPKIIAVFHFRF